MEDSKEFEQLKEHEETLLAIYRKSLIPYAKSFIVALFIIPIFIFFSSYFPNLINLFQAIVISMIIIALILLQVWYLWERSSFLVTNIRVITIDQKSLFHREIQEADYSDVCNIGAKVKGLKQSIFKYGSILVQTQSELWLENIEHPYEVKEIIYEAIHKHKHKHIRTLPKKFWNNKV